MNLLIAFAIDIPLCAFFAWLGWQARGMRDASDLRAYQAALRAEAEE